MTCAPFCPITLLKRVLQGYTVPHSVEEKNLHNSRHPELPQENKSNARPARKPSRKFDPNRTRFGGLQTLYQTGFVDRFVRRSRRSLQTMVCSKPVWKPSMEVVCVPIIRRFASRVWLEFGNHGLAIGLPVPNNRQTVFGYQTGLVGLV